MLIARHVEQQSGGSHRHGGKGTMQPRGDDASRAPVEFEQLTRALKTTIRIALVERHMGGLDNALLGSALYYRRYSGWHIIQYQQFLVASVNAAREGKRSAPGEVT